MRETRLSGSEGGARFNPLSLPLSSKMFGQAIRASILHPPSAILVA